ncbi:MAG TPA: NAD(P)H-dependent glycerol-3-phosphate dehydrogenase [Candidatus Omnitrophota bacterium]|nr:NAD(P)H-dependent glycerol-3-phosphate dehydrogenase [Candidatus Omnitrophota bacterium]
MTPETIAFIGDGSWGTTLAVYLAQKKHPVFLWGAFPENIAAMKQQGENKKFLPGIRFPKDLHATSDLEEAIRNSSIVVLSTPSQYLDQVLKRIKKTHTYNSLKSKTLLSIVKGIDTRKLLCMSDLIKQELGKLRFAVLSGPTIAREVALGVPSTAVVASTNHQAAKHIQKLFNSQTFRIYRSSDVAGVELGGSLKNVIAIACGVCDGLGYGTNTKSAILTRGLVEMIRLGTHLGARAKTFYGLAGMGDLATTCFNPLSRNRSVGQALGEGKTITQVLKHMNMVAEGVETSKAVEKISRRSHIDMPICHEVYQIITRNKSPKKAVSDLMSRKTKAE